MDRERTRIENATMRSAMTAIRKLRSDLIVVANDGGDPNRVVSAFSEDLERSILSGMMAAHLQGRLRSLVVQDVARRGKLSLSRTVDQVQAFLSQRLQLTPLEEKSIEAQYGAAARSAAGDLAASARMAVEKATANAIREQLTTKSAVESIRAALDRQGVTLQRPYAIETIFRTTMQTAYSAGRWSANEDPAVQEILWGYEYSAVMDDRTTDLCSELDGMRRPKTDEVWRRLWPPNHYNAVAEGEPITTSRGRVPIEDVRVGDLVMTHRGRFRRVYATMHKAPDTGTIRELRLSTGGVLRVTDEHPVLTANGWKAARDLQIGDVLFERGQKVSGRGRVDLPNPEDFPSLPDEPVVAWDVVTRSPLSSVGLSIDLQGNFVAGKREVDRIRAHGMLERERHAALVEHRSPSLLRRRRLLAPSGTARDRRAFAHSGIAHGIVTQHALAGIGARLPKAPVILARAIGDYFGLAIGDPDLMNPAAYGYPVAFAEGREHGLPQTFRTLNAADRLAALPVPGLNQPRSRRNVELDGHVWTPASIISTAAISATARVWNLGVEEDETYLVRGVIVHNCRSQPIEVFVGDALAIPTDIPPVEAMAGFGFNSGLVFGDQLRRKAA